MQVSKAASIWLDYHRSNSRENTFAAYEAVINRLITEFGEKDLRELTTEEILTLMTRLTADTKPQTKRTRFSHLSAFFNLIRHNIDPQSPNPCDTPMMKKLFNQGGLVRWHTIDKETVDVIFKASNPRNRIILELTAKGGMRSHVA